MPVLAAAGPVDDAVSDAVTAASGYVTTAIPLILGVALLWVGLKYGKRLLAKI